MQEYGPMDGIADCDSPREDTEWMLVAAEGPTDVAMDDGLQEFEESLLR